MTLFSSLALKCYFFTNKFEEHKALLLFILKKRFFVIFENISFIYNEKITEVANVGYEMNQVRLKRNPLEIYIFNKNTEAALKFISSEHLEKYFVQ